MIEKNLTRDEYKLAKQNEEEQPVAKPAEKRWVRVRLIPIWLRLIILVFLIVIALAAGAVVGYSVFGDGKPSDVFKRGTWEHIVDLVNKET
ncbi:DNA-directed RNA polymerase subunit beta [Peribacillus saganii]|uniref:DNA-directed RNA polymerase subunit beta n=1 Tax=Peribacillus saganii TaxID=2303992 RepID=A0A372LLE5_9BACI|nr:DNA-directed RNA polymerase subunit beta [Peribacillus saganii]RFU67094.1 DNA-directed RNA polymerase subunit beta [Peribacillus saganii]